MIFMKIYNVAVVSVFFVVAAMASSAAFALDIDLATAGISVCDPGSSNQVYAARELEKHLNMISGRKGKARMTNGANAVFMIGTPAPGKGKAADFEALAAVRGGKVYFWGDDGRRAYKGEVPCGGSMFAVYAFLDKVLGVKWVYPGDDGIVYKKLSRISVKEGWKDRFVPPLLSTRMRGGDAFKSKNLDPDGSLKWEKYVPTAMRKTIDDEKRFIAETREWMLRMRHQTREQFSFGHAFEHWNKRFFRSHPEYLAMNEDGTRGISPSSRRKAKHVKLCVSHTAGDAICFIIIEGLNRVHDQHIGLLRVHAL